MQTPYKSSRLIGMMCCITTLFIAWQLTLFIIHYHLHEIIDSLAQASLVTNLLHPVTLLPILAHILIIISTYALIICWIYFAATTISAYLRLSATVTYWLGIAMLFLAWVNLLALNSYYFPFSFFAFFPYTPYLLLISAGCWLIIAFITYLHFFWYDRKRVAGWVFLLITAINICCAWPTFSNKPANPTSQPNIIIIGLDSLRPDFIHYFGNQAIHTPHIDNFLKHSATFTHTYTPLARTFPAWISILTGKHPKHHGARNNLADASNAVKEETLAKTLQRAGYYTIYATDEKRFSNITSEYGFNQITEPPMGVNDFLLGGLTDFPLTNLLTKLPAAKYLLPYHYANRAAAITYQPEQFIDVLKQTLAHRPNQPLFLAVHFCLTHWPYTWANIAGKQEIQPQQYAHSVEAVDQQVGQLFVLLKQHHLLNNSIVVLLSDHGTALGLPNDTLLDRKNYHGIPVLLKNIPVAKLSSAPSDSIDFKKDYTINTSYGQGNNVTSLTQYQTVLAFRQYGGKSFSSGLIHTPVLLTDIYPTLLAALKLPKPNTSDGISLLNELRGGLLQKSAPRAFFIETADTLGAIETDHIQPEKVIALRARTYKVNSATGLLTMNPTAENEINTHKQRAVLYGDWLLAHYPANMRYTLAHIHHSSQLTVKTIVMPPYDVLVNMRTKQWTIGLDTAFAQTAPVDVLKNKLKDFYGEEISLR